MGTLANDQDVGMRPVSRGWTHLRSRPPAGGVLLQDDALGYLVGG